MFGHPVRGAAVALGLFALAAAAAACPFCTQEGKTLTREVSEAKLVVFGTLANPNLKFAPDGTDQSTTDLLVEEVVKDHEFLKGKKTVVLPRYMPLPNEPVKFLIFADIYKEKLDPYRGIASGSKEMVQYLKGALKLPEKDMPKRLRFFLDYLDHPDVEVASDAYREFAAADYKDVEALVKTVDAAKLRKKLVAWLKDRDTAAYRFGFYGMLLGLVGTREDGEAFRDLLDDPDRGLITGMDGVMAGYVRADKEAGWTYLQNQLRAKDAPYARRYAALRAARFLWKFQPDVVPQKDLTAAISLLLDQPDLADLAIDDLRKLKVWGQADAVLPLFGKPSHQAPQIRRSILRFALQCPGEKPKAFIAEQRQKDAKLVEQVEEFLKLELPDS